LLDDEILYKGLKESEKQDKCLSSEKIKALQPCPLFTSKRGVEEDEEEGIEILPQASEEISQPVEMV